MRYSRIAAKGCSALQCCVVIGTLLACARPDSELGTTDPRSPSTGRIERFVSAPASRDEAYCAWFGNSRDGILYFGSAAFWSSYRLHGNDARADLLSAGPQPIGRFELATERHLEPLDVGETSSRSGVWDVLPHSNGHLYFTTLYEGFGSVSQQGDHVRIFSEAGDALNELAHGPDGTILASRYWGPDFSSGSVVLFDPDGTIRVELPLASDPGTRLAPKTPAYDPARQLIWITSDRLIDGPEEQAPIPGPGGEHHPTLLLDLDGRERLVIDEIEIHELGFNSAGTGYFAFVGGSQLRLHVLEVSEAPEVLLHRSGILIDGDFPAQFDFVQDLAFDDEGHILLTRWSGHLHWIDPQLGAAGVKTMKLPSYDDGGLYYASVLAGDRVCSTYCSDLSVVCADSGDFVHANQGGPGRDTTTGIQPR